MVTIKSQCLTCKHYNNHDKEKFSCLAYPDSIPDDIIDNILMHDKVLENQKNEYMYEKKESDEYVILPITD